MAGDKHELVALRECVVERLDVRIGNLEIRSEHPGFMGSVIVVDDRKLAVRSLKLEGDVKGIWRATIEYYPGVKLTE